MGTVLAVLGIFFGFICFIVIVSYFSTWIQAYASGAHISFLKLIGMSLRKIPSGLIVRHYIQLRKAGITEVTTDDLEGHFMAHGHIDKVVNALVAADKANIPLDFRRAAAIDLAGRDVYQAVQTSVNPKVIDCPDPSKGRNTVDAVAKDGIQVKARARVTVRTNMDRLVGGATEETIIARVGEGIVTTVLENPDNISQRVLEKGLDAGTAFEILSIDIADVDVGDNIGARLQADQAEADKRVAQAKAEVRRAAAVAAEQEMRAQVQEMQAKVVAAEAEVPLAMAEALKNGNLGVLDYYRMENLKSDTEMRRNILGEEEK